MSKNTIKDVLTSAVIAGTVLVAIDQAFGENDKTAPPPKERIAQQVTSGKITEAQAAQANFALDGGP